MTKTRTYKAWSAMKARCYRESEPAYKWYGARGITVCKRWRSSFLNFLHDMGEAPLGLQLDRKDNQKGYSRNNCRWVTPMENSNNKRNNKKYKIKGKIKTMREWSTIYGIEYYLIKDRARNGKRGIDLIKPKMVNKKAVSSLRPS